MTFSLCNSNHVYCENKSVAIFVGPVGKKGLAESVRVPTVTCCASFMHSVFIHRLYNFVSQCGVKFQHGIEVKQGLHPDESVFITYGHLVPFIFVAIQKFI